MEMKVNKEKVKLNYIKLMNILKQILFIIMLVMTFYISQKLAIIIDLVSVQTLSQFINVALAVIVVLIYKKK